MSDSTSKHTVASVKAANTIETPARSSVEQTVAQPKSGSSAGYRKRLPSWLYAQKAGRAARRRSLPENFFLKRLDTFYWRRVLRYLYIRFLRMQGSPRAIALGLAAGVFAGSFPLLGFQTLIGVAIAALVGGNKVVAAAGTWISNPLTYLPLFALNFHIGRLLLRLPPTTALPVSADHLNDWMAMGMDVGAALLLGSCVVGLIASVLGYYAGFTIAQRVQTARGR
ncbi:MAG: DUF2062 domain-containing protein [Phormidesmis sp.]